KLIVKKKYGWVRRSTFAEAMPLIVAALSVRSKHKSLLCCIALARTAWGILATGEPYSGIHVCLLNKPV
ncbi:hypothetical protein, partial [Oleiphilus sp. HI0066]|uniref:hypothetical protein n=1 Tax=Oleiphilus sp. HI0066 TaxID=1822242 RepID=UPI001E2CAB2D